MFLWLLLITSSQLWWAAVCPPSQRDGHDCNMAGKNSSKYEVLVNINNRRVLQVELTSERAKLGLKTGGEKVNLTKKGEEALRDDGENVDDDPNKTYWNRTNERCDYERIRCMRAYATGAVCARTLYYQYYSFPNYCALDFHNCVGRYAYWQLAYMGICTEIDIEKEFYVQLTYDQMENFTFLTQMYTEDSGALTNVG